MVGQQLHCALESIERRTRPIDESLGWLATRARELRAIDRNTLWASLVGERFDGQPANDDTCVTAFRMGAVAS
jgi:hypothetical protein